ncbi:hypothetical protein [Streptomyces sp. AC627_RSS907]|uniref:hypothetical protein n=1 Tax=Streptomyces sp. AC627_RSS907 TaxID=2823684 RepID=UPI001C280509|nr:hypothetical protein [Streptomyces sp. AC627_RSS907]
MRTTRVAPSPGLAPGSGTGAGHHALGDAVEHGVTEQQVGSPQQWGGLSMVRGPVVPAGIDGFTELYRRTGTPERADADASMSRMGCEAARLVDLVEELPLVARPDEHGAAAARALRRTPTDPRARPPTRCTTCAPSVPDARSPSTAPAEGRRPRRPCSVAKPGCVRSPPASWATPSPAPTPPVRR